MSHYIRIPRINGRLDLCKLGEWLNNNGLSEVDYDPGGWQGDSMNNAAAHLKFESEDDALAFVLAHGGVYSTVVPELEPHVEPNWLT